MISAAPMQKEHGTSREYTEKEIRLIQLFAANYIVNTVPDSDNWEAEAKELMSMIGTPHDRIYGSDGNRLRTNDRITS